MKGRAIDCVLAGSGLAAGALMFATGQYQARVAPVWLFAPLAVCCGALLLRRTAPPASVLIGTAAVAADVAIRPSLATPLVYTQVLYDDCVHGRAALARTLLAASVIGSVVTAVACLVVVRDVRALGIAVLLDLVTVVPVLTGNHVRHHRDRAAAARRSAEQVARLAEADRANAVAAERAGLARELHDVIANHLSLDPPIDVELRLPFSVASTVADGCVGGRDGFAGRSGVLRGGGRARAGRLVTGQAMAGGAWTRSNRPCQGCCHGQWAGRCRTRRRALRASRAGMVISCRRMAAVRAVA